MEEKVVFFKSMLKYWQWDYQAGFTYSCHITHCLWTAWLNKNFKCIYIFLYLVAKNYFYCRIHSTLFFLPLDVKVCLLLWDLGFVLVFNFKDVSQKFGNCRSVNIEHKIESECASVLVVALSFNSCMIWASYFLILCLDYKMISLKMSCF